jgi:hypothetical protein
VGSLTWSDRSMGATLRSVCRLRGELTELLRLVQQHSPVFLEKWNEFFGD